MVIHPWRILRQALLLLLVVLPAGVVGTVLALGWLPPGRLALTRLAQGYLSQQMEGRILLTQLRGNLLSRIELRGITVLDHREQVVLQADHLGASYSLADLLAGRILLHDVVLAGASVHLIQSPDGSWNYEEVFRTGSNDSVPGIPPLVQLSNLRLEAVNLRIDIPTEPVPPPVPITRNAATPAAPRIETAQDGSSLMVYQIDGIAGRLELLRVSTPEDDPVLARITTLQALVAYPAVQLLDLQGEISTAADSLSFQLSRVALPGSLLHGSGKLRWPRGPLLFDFALDADSLDLKDLRWISPDFPDWHGSARVEAHSFNERRTDYRLTSLRMGNGSATATGRFTAIVDTLRGLGFDDLSLNLSRVPLEVARPFLDTLPLLGTLDGRLDAGGYLDSLSLSGDLIFTDVLVPGAPRSHLVMRGILRFDESAGATFQDFQLTRSSVDLATVRRLVPVVELPGTLTLDGTVDGPWMEVSFNGAAQHIAPDQSLTRMLGRVQLDTRDSILGVDLDATFDPLSFDAIRSGYPDIVARGGLVGHLALVGKLDRLQVDADLTGEVGTLQLNGHFGLQGDTLLTDSLSVRFYSLDLDALLGRFGRTSLNGRALVSGTWDTLTNLRGELSLGLDRSRVGEFLVEATEARIRADSGVAMIDTLRVDLPDGWIDVEGDIGLDDQSAGTLLIDTGFTTLAPWDSLLRAHFELTPDTLGPQKLGGTVHGAFRVSGSVGDPRITGSAQARGVVFDRWMMSRAVATVRADSLGWRGLNLTLDADSLGQGTNLSERVAIDLTGRRDSLEIGVTGRFRQARLATGAHWSQRDSTAGSGWIDSLGLFFPTQSWRLSQPSRIAWEAGRLVLPDTLLLATNNGGGRLSLGGSLPGNDPGDLSFSLSGLDLRTLAALQQEPGDFSGTAALDFRLRGTASAPLLNGSGSLTGPAFGSLRFPLIHTTFDYQDQRLNSQVAFWKTGDPLLQAKLSLPYDLAFSPKGPRKLPGDLEITARAGSDDLSLLSGFNNSMQQVSGKLDLNFRASGSWAQPRLEGNARIEDGSFQLPDIGTRYTGLQAWLRFSGDSIIADTFRVRSDEGSLYLRGNLRLLGLTEPTLDLNLRTTTDFLLVDIPGFMTVRPAGEVQLVGPLMQPVLTGAMAVANSQVYYTDIVSKTLLDLSDPLISDLVDTAAIRRLGLERSFQSRFLDSLRINGLRLRVAEDVWLRSAEANIMVASDGEARITKAGRDYTVTGSFDAVRGTYDLTLAYALTKTFNIDRGTVSFFGTPDLNGTLNLQASRKVRSNTGEEIPLQATITGTILTPEISLTSPDRNLSSTDAVAYLLTGGSVSELGVGQSARNRFLGSTASSFISAAASQAFSKQLGVGVNVNLASANEYGLALSQQLGDQAFVSLSGDVCLGQSTWAALMEYSLSSEFRLQISRRPVRTCDATRTSTDYSAKYQFGADLVWRREY